MMDTRICRLWADVLPRYTQGYDRLRRGSAFCPLGVLCDLHARETGMRWTVQDGYYSYLGASVLLPEAVVSWAGFTEEEILRRGAFGIGVRLAGLTVSLLNDAGRPLAAIAADIREELAGNALEAAQDGRSGAIAVGVRE